MTDPVLVNFLAWTCFENIRLAISFHARNINSLVFKMVILFNSKEDLFTWKSSKKWKLLNIAATNM